MTTSNHHADAPQTCSVREIAIDPDTLVRALLSLAATRRLSLLDSCGYYSSNEARYLIAAFDPCETIEARGTKLLVETSDTPPRVVNHPSALEYLTARLAAYPSLHLNDDDAQPVCGGLCIATLSYTLATRFLDLRFDTSKALPAFDEPDAVFAFYDALIVHDYKLRRTFISTIRGEERLNRLAAELLDLTQRPPPINSNETTVTHTAVSNFTPTTYKAAVRRIKEHIFAGDIYQANLTQKFTCDLDHITTPEVVFNRLRRAHPASHAAFIRRRDDAVISISPERFLRVYRPHNLSDKTTRIITAAPIKGTRPRGKDEIEDSRLRHELATSAKDRAENVMIVDLMRNDLGRVCEYASVAVTDLCRVETHPTLFHLVSIVRGRLRPNVTIHELIHATFPSGSITGAPKLRAMEIIHTIEPHNRELSMGAIGFFAFDGTLDLSVAIRTMTMKNSCARFATGGGVTADSDPTDEYAESLVKARALLKALNAKLTDNG